MGAPYKQIENFLSEVSGSHVMVEIGSDRGEGSTEYLDRLAGRFNTKLYSVDILPKSKSRLTESCTNTEFVVAQGSTWSQDFYLKHHNMIQSYLIWKYITHTSLKMI